MTTIFVRIASAIAGLALAIAPADAQSITYTQADRATLRAYVLTMDKLERYGKANDAITRDAPTSPALQHELSIKQSPSSLTDMLAVVQRHPLTLAYFHKVGLSDRDAILLPLVVINASVVSAQPNLAAELPTTPAQIAFVKAHYADLKNLHISTN